MHALRTSSSLARLVLAWFVLTLGIAGVSPIVHPKAMELVCTAEGSIRMLVAGDDGTMEPVGAHTLDCALCLAPMLPWPQVQARVAAPQPLGHALQPIVAARMAAIVGAPLPPRGPPQA